MTHVRQLGPGWVFDFDLGPDICCGAFPDQEYSVRHGLQRRKNHCVWCAALRTKEKTPSKAFLQALAHRALRVQAHEQAHKDPQAIFAVQPDG